MSPRPLDPEPDPFEPSLTLAREGRHAEAVAGLKGTLLKSQLHPSHRSAAAGALARVAKLAEASGDLENAEQALAEALRVAPHFADLHYQHACVLLARGRRPDARAALDRALAANPRYVAARVERALLDAREGMLGESLALLRALGDELKPEQPRLFRQGLKSLERADWEEAETLLKSALKLSDPGVAEAIRRFQALIASDQRAEGLALLRDVLRRHESYADLHLLLGTAELEDGNVDDALASLARALELHPDYHDARIQFARALEALGDVTQAVEQIALVLERDPEHPKAVHLHERWSRRQSRRRRTREPANPLDPVPRSRHPDGVPPGSG